MDLSSHSELLFEGYLKSLSMEFAYEPEMPGRKKRPDYCVLWDGRHYWFEVKELDEPQVRPKHTNDPIPPIRQKINDARSQFKEYKGEPCILVLHGCKSIRRTATLPAVVAAAFGSRLTLRPIRGQTIVDEPFRFQFRADASLRPNVNTTFSAIVILEHFELEWRRVEAFHRVKARVDRGEEVSAFAHAEELELISPSENKREFENSVRALLLENPYAKTPVPRGFPLGPLDQRWGLNPSSAWYTLLSLGEKLSELRARTPPVPFALL